MAVADGKQTVAFGPGQSVGSLIATACLQERQRTIIRHEMTGKESFRRAKAFGEKFPQSPAADFGARAIKTQDGPFGSKRHAEHLLDRATTEVS